MVRQGGPSMEATLYDEEIMDMSQLKRRMTLDLNSGLKRNNRLALGVSPLLSSPDLNMLKLASPELEKFIISQQNGLVTTTPTPNAQGQYVFPRQAVTEEQEMYARGFVEALNELHSNDSSGSDQSSLLDVSPTTYTNLEPPTTLQSLSSIPVSQSTGASQFHPPQSQSPYGVHPLTIKDEPQIVPNLGSPPMSPINMENQEKIKLERKRQRNRIAASKCRRRKLERIARLEDKVKLLKNENTELAAVVTKLKDQVCGLKQQVMEHVSSGCQIMVSPHF